MSIEAVGVMNAAVEQYDEKWARQGPLLYEDRTAAVWATATVVLARRTSAGWWAVRCGILLHTGLVCVKTGIPHFNACVNGTHARNVGLLLACA